VRSAGAAAPTPPPATGSMPEPLGSEEIAALVADFARHIGDHEQHHPGIVEQLDPLLRRDAAPAERAVALDAHRVNGHTNGAALHGIARPMPAAMHGPASADRGSIERWLQRWIATRTQQDAANVEKQRPFADYGLDSVTAVELADELSKFVGVEVPATAAWDHPNIATLTGAIIDALGRSSADRGTHRPAANGHAPDSAELDDMSEQELASLLAGALDDSEARRQ
jgi:acyl carrier protein